MTNKTRKGGPVTIEVKITNELKRTRQDTTTLQIKKEHDNGLVTIKKDNNKLSTISEIHKAKWHNCIDNVESSI